VRWLSFIGLVVVLLVLASSGLLRGDMCAGQIGCVGANAGGITLHGARP
jgi:hypothetical protein